VARLTSEPAATSTNPSSAAQPRDSTHSPLCKSIACRRRHHAASCLVCRHLPTGASSVGSDARARMESDAKEWARSLRRACRQTRAHAPHDAWHELGETRRSARAPAGNNRSPAHSKSPCRFSLRACRMEPERREQLPHRATCPISSHPLMGSTSRKPS
jgi:hypothetical protein